MVSPTDKTKNKMMRIIPTFKVTPIRMVSIRFVIIAKMIPNKDAILNIVILNVVLNSPLFTMK